MNIIYPLCSSSKGNAVYVGDYSRGVLIDCGIGIRNLTNALKLNHISLSAIQAVFVTHEHSDHIKGLAKLSENIPVAICSNVPTLRELIAKGAVGPKARLKEINRKPAEFCGMEITSFRTSHDSIESVGYRVRFEDGKQFCLCTDLGYVSEEAEAALLGSELVMIESNYEESMLLSGNYPWYLKQRIRSRNGHLSNHDCAEELSRLAATGVQRFILGHLSEENNRPELALSCAVSRLAEDGLKPASDFEITVAPRTTSGKLVEL